MKLRLSVRDLLWLMLVIALAIGWWVRELMLADVARQTEIERLVEYWTHSVRADAWRRRTGTLERALTAEGYTVRWNSPKAGATTVTVSKNDRTSFTLDTADWQPSIQDD